MRFPAAGTVERKELEEILEAAGLLPEVSAVQVNKLAALVESGELAALVESGDLAPDVAAKIKKFAWPEPSSSVSLSKLKDGEMVAEESS